jgi:hypothetical protein
MKAALLLMSAALLTGCRFSFDKTMEGNTNVKTEQRSVSDFTGVEVAGPFQVTVQQGSSYQISVTADDNLLPYIETEKNGQTLEIREKDNFNLRGTKGLQVVIQMPTVRNLSLAGSGILSSASTLKSDGKIDLDIAGSGKIQAELDAPEISMDIAGSGSATLSGQTRKMGISISGSGDCLSEALKSENCNVSIAGSGTAKIYASQTLDVSIGGSGDVYYAGQPKISQSIGGSGKIKPL